MLTETILPAGTKEIYGNAFDHCSSMTKLVIPESVEKIHNCAVQYSYALTVYCAEESRPVGWHTNWNQCGSSSDPMIAPVVWDCENNVKADDGKNYKMIDGICTRWMMRIKRHQCPDSVMNIEIDAFGCCRGVTTVTMGSDVEKVGTRAFQGCKSLINFQYNGTRAQWKAIPKEGSWCDDESKFTVHCSDDP